MKTVAIITAYNEASTIREVVKKAKKYVDQVIVVDDGSINSTYENAKDADILIRNPVNILKIFTSLVI